MTTPDVTEPATEAPTAPPTENPLRPGWGFAPPPEVPAIAAWGARAIYSLPRVNLDPPRRKRGARKPASRVRVPEATVDLLWDRQGSAGDADGMKLLQDWLNAPGGALQQLRQRCAKEYVTTDCDDVITITDGAFTLIASPRSSYGYLYIGAWVVA